MIKKVLVANRGEIAVRIIRACKEMDIKTVAVYSEADRDARHVQLADEAFCVGPGPVTGSYLNIPNIISAALVSGADAVHPGYGFLAENVQFVTICQSHNLTFVGPPPQAMELMGDKSQARETMKRAGVPTLPGTTNIADEAAAISFAREAGYPVLIKATAGGGGKGMRIAQDEPSLLNLIPIAKAEAQAAFGDDRVYLEKFLPQARHVEIQVVADQHGHVVSLFERDCSAQRRNQKLIEESPSPGLPESVRLKMCEAAVSGARASGYVNAGTIEFLVDPRSWQFYFLEMNTRIQVEHPVTEMVTGIDLVQLQLRIAANEPLPFSENDLTLTGHAIECRINAEDPDRGFVPSTGTLEGLTMPGGPGVRIDSHATPGMNVSPFYDSLLAKVIVWGRDRETALNRMSRALDEFHVKGVATTVPILQRLIHHPRFRAGDIHTTWVESDLIGDRSPALAGRA